MASKWRDYLWTAALLMVLLPGKLFLVATSCSFYRSATVGKVKPTAPDAFHANRRPLCRGAPNRRRCFDFGVFRIEFGADWHAIQRCGMSDDLLQWKERRI